MLDFQVLSTRDLYHRDIITNVVCDHKYSKYESDKDRIEFVLDSRVRSKSITDENSYIAIVVSELQNPDEYGYEWFYPKYFGSYKSTSEKFESDCEILLSNYLENPKEFKSSLKSDMFY